MLYVETWPHFFSRIFFVGQGLTDSLICGNIEILTKCNTVCRRMNYDCDDSSQSTRELDVA